MQELKASRADHVDGNDTQTHMLHVNERKNIVHSVATPSVCKATGGKGSMSPSPHCSRSSAFQHLPETFPKTVIQESIQEGIQARVSIA